jgi:Holliday junction resolvase RusA-like endonuclease
MITLVFDIAPQPKERPRFSSRGKFVRTFTAPKTKTFEAAIAAMARAQMKGKPLTCLLVTTIVFEFKRPKRTKLPTPKKDIDNLCKSVLDALNGIVFNDDTQVVHLNALKKWSDRDRISFYTQEDIFNV